MKIDGIAAVVVTYLPGSDVLGRVLALAEFVGRVVVVDNSAPSALSLKPLENHPRITLIARGENLGVAAGLNLGVREAARLGYELVLLLDQDSTVTAEALTELLTCVRPGNAITALSQPRGTSPRADSRAPAWRDADVVITSGSLLDVRAFEACGDFLEKLFIDYVDHDYCLRLRRAGFRIIQSTRAVLAHALGERRKARVLFVERYYTSHRPFRLYYIARNGLYVVATHGATFPRIALSVMRILVTEALKAVLLEDEKQRRLRYLACGIVDYFRGRFGRLREADAV